MKNSLCWHNPAYKVHVYICSLCQNKYENDQIYARARIELILYSVISGLAITSKYDDRTAYLQNSGFHYYERPYISYYDINSCKLSTWYGIIEIEQTAAGKWRDKEDLWAELSILSSIIFIADIDRRAESSCCLQQAKISIWVRRRYL